MTRNNPQDPLFDDQPQGMLARLLPPLVLMCAFGGFIALAIYAYKAGTQSVKDGELMVVEADNTPVKEKPADPGGMQFPNQDKTIFETFSANNGKPPKVERVLPTPEEPIAKNNDSAEPTTWVNGKLASATAATAITAEQVFGDEDAPPEKTSGAKPVDAKTDVDTPIKIEEKPESQVKNVREELGKQAIAEASPSAASAIEVPIAPVAVVAKPVATKPADPAPKAAAKIEAPEKPTTKPVEKPAAKPADKPKASGGKELVQLGAYKSEDEAKTDYAKIQKKNPALAGKPPVINRADLGDKGIFFRLRVATDDAKTLCSKLSASHQACMAVK